MKIKKLRPSDNSAQSAPEAIANAKKSSVKKAPVHVHLLSLHFLLHVFFKKLFSIALIGIGAVIIAMMCFTINSESSASKTISLNYEESTKGKTPNGSRFSLSDFLVQDYMNDIIDEIGFQGELTAADLSDIISIYPTSNGRVVTDEDGYYINSSYTVSVKLPRELQLKISADDLLDKVCDTFEKQFINANRVTVKSLTLDADYDEMDYDEISSYFYMMLNRIKNYIDVRNNQNGSFISDNGLSYSAIRKACINLQIYTLAEFDGYIWENGVSKDRDRRIANLKEINRELTWDYKSNSEKSQKLMDVLEGYNNKLVSSVLIPTYDSNGAFYMSRTKVGIDDLALQADTYLSEAVSLNKSISTNLSKLSALARVPGAAKLARANEMVAQISSELGDIISQISDVDTACYAQRINGYLMFTKPETSLMESLNVMSSIEVALIVCLLWYVLAVLFIYRRQKKKQY